MTEVYLFGVRERGALCLRIRIVANCLGFLIEYRFRVSADDVNEQTGCVMQADVWFI